MISPKPIQNDILLDLHHETNKKSQRNSIHRLKSYSNYWSGDILSSSITLTPYAGISDCTSWLPELSELLSLRVDFAQTCSIMFSPHPQATNQLWFSRWRSVSFNDLHFVTKYVQAFPVCYRMVKVTEATPPDCQSLSEIWWYVSSVAKELLTCQWSHFKEYFPNTINTMDRMWNMPLPHTCMSKTLWIRWFNDSMKQSPTSDNLSC